MRRRVKVTSRALLPPLTLLDSPPAASLLLHLPVPVCALVAQQQQVCRFVATTEGRCAEQTHELRPRVSVVPRALPCSTRLLCAPTTSVSPSLPLPLGSQERQARRLVAYTKNRGGEQTHERQRVRVVSRALLPAPALLYSPAATSDCLDLPDPPRTSGTQQP